MSEQFDRQEGLRRQYKDSSNLMARVQLHDRFGQIKRDFHRWVFEHLHVPQNGAVLELGCGPGQLWVRNKDRIPPDWRITLSDFSPGMLKEAEENLRDSGRSFSFQLIDAQAIPFAAQSLDTVIANHMLYHVPDKPKALSEMRRILKPDGRLYTVTNGEKHLRELRELLVPFTDPSIVSQSILLESDARSYTVENAVPQLRRWFAHVEVDATEDQLVVTEAEPLMAYICSGYLKNVLTEEQLDALRKTIEQRIAADGAVRITRASGMLEAYGVIQAPTA